MHVCMHSYKFVQAQSSPLKMMTPHLVAGTQKKAQNVHAFWYLPVVSVASTQGSQSNMAIRQSVGKKETGNFIGLGWLAKVVKGRGYGGWGISLLLWSNYKPSPSTKLSAKPRTQSKNIKTINKRNEEYPILVNGLTGLTSPIKPRISSSEASLFPQTISVPHTATPRHSLPRRSRPFPLERRPGAKSDLKSFNGLVRIPTGKAGNAAFPISKEEENMFCIYKFINWWSMYVIFTVIW